MMRYKSILAVYKKEMLEILRDKKTLVIMVLVPIILYPLIMIGSMQLGISMSKTNPNVPISIATNANDEALIQRLHESTEPKIQLESVEDIQAALDEGKINAYLQSNENGEFSILYDGSKDASLKAKNEMNSILNDYKMSLVENNLVAIGQDAKTILEPISITSENLAKNESMIGMLLGMLLPFLLITVIMMGAMYPAIDITAGEKERGTLETLLTLPISNFECISAKFLAVSTVACITGLLNLVSIGISGGFMLSQVSLLDEGLNLNLAGLIPGFLVTIACIIIFALFISAVVMCVCMFANSFKEASNYITPLTLIVMLPCMLTLMPDVTLSTQTMAIPVLNIALLIKGALVGNLDVYLTSMTLVLNAMYAFLAIYGLSRIFKSESMLFKDGSSSMFELRSNIKKRDVPQIADTFLLYLISMFLLIYVGGYFQLKLGFQGLVVNQFIIFSCCFGLSIYLKTELKQTFHFHFPKILNFLGGIILIIGMIIINLAFSNYWLVGNDLIETAESMTKILTPPNAFMGYFVVAFLPAIAEEMFFRGFVLSSLLKRVKPWMAILGSALLFGLFHLNFVQMIPATLTGIVLAYITYKSKSIYPAMLMHFANNAFAQSSILFPEKFVFIDEFFADILQGEAIGLMLIGVGIVGIGYSLTRWANVEHHFTWFKKQVIVSEVKEALPIEVTVETKTTIEQEVETITEEGNEVVEETMTTELTIEEGNQGNEETPETNESVKEETVVLEVSEAELTIEDIIQKPEEIMSDEAENKG